MPLPLVFICYARVDNDPSRPLERRWLDRVRQHLQPFENQNQFEVFYDGVIEPGDHWHARIQSKLREAKVAILLVSSSFLASKYVSTGELPVLLQRSGEGGLRIIPILVSSSNWDRVFFTYPDPEKGPQKLKLSQLQSAGSPRQTLEDLPYNQQERILTEVAGVIVDHLEQLVQVPPSPAPAPSGFTNSLGMRFVPVDGTRVGFCIWPTRVQDYSAFAAETPDLYGSWRDPKCEGFPVTPGPTHPVVNVSWDDANRFCEWLTQKEINEGRLKPWEHYRLPTDLEWSVAVGLVGETGANPKERDMKVPGVYPWGTEWPPPPGAGNFADETARKSFPKWNVIEGYRDGFATTSPVGSFRPSKSGLFDLSGNVWEWCSDWWDDKKEYRVLRGGSWSHPFETSKVWVRDCLNCIHGSAEPRAQVSLPKTGSRTALAHLSQLEEIFVNFRE